jgi:uncharacterized protein YbaR (Trm112 family)
MGSKFMGLSRPHLPLNKGCPLRVFFSIAYPIRDGIPIMLPGEARKLEQ